eukprot:1548664-Pleurochrysis_carterae.AAC.1
MPYDRLPSRGQRVLDHAPMGVKPVFWRLLVDVPVSEDGHSLRPPPVRRRVLAASTAVERTLRRRTANKRCASPFMPYDCLPSREQRMLHHASMVVKPVSWIIFTRIRVHLYRFPDVFYRLMLVVPGLLVDVPISEDGHSLRPPRPQTCSGGIHGGGEDAQEEYGERTACLPLHAL